MVTRDETDPGDHRTMSMTTHVCRRCGREFDAHPSAQTAKLGYCSQRCMTAVEP